MIALLSYSINLLASDDKLDNNLPTGVLATQDSTMIAFDDLRIVNSKLIELEYEKEINERYKVLVHNDSIVIKQYTELNNNLNKELNKVVKQRNYIIGAGVAITILVTILLLVK